MDSSSQRVSALLSSTEPSSPRWKYDVFLSFRGEETRKGIAFELYDGLKNREGIKTFMDDQELQVGAPISPSLLQAIEESRFAIIVLSPNYAYSSWCLEELTKIVDCMKNENRILPLFYHVEPSDVRHQKNSFEVAFTKHEATKRHKIQKLKKWRDALKTVANFSGWHTQNYKTERELVEALVKSVCKKVRPTEPVGRQVGVLADYKSNRQNLALCYGRKEFSDFANDVLPQDICLLSTSHYIVFRSRNSIVTSVMDELRNPNTEMILVWGIAGVGKTTLVEQVLRQAKHDNLFDDVVMVRAVKENPDLEKIQKEIATKLGLSIPENHTLAERAPILCDRIKDKRTLVVLDDVWEQIDLLAIGLPRLVTCKLVLTCRSRKDLSMDMRTQKDISLDVLNEEEAWSLFEKMAGGVVKDSCIRSVAIEVARKCGGLPVLIVTVARALKDRNKLHAWKDTLRRLRGFDKKELTEKTYLALEWSYDQLEDKELKPLFLLCGIVVDKNHIYLERLCKYGMGLGLFKKVDTMEEARDLLGTLVEKLIDSCLLLDNDSNVYFRMHDLVCEVASRIASRDQHVLSVEYGGDELQEMCLESSNIPMLSEVPRECSKLEMFYLYSKDLKSVEIPFNFFSDMEKLKVLGLTKLHMLSLPSSLQFLKNLQTLCLEQCILGEIVLVGHLSNLEILSFARSKIERIPKEMGKLIRLRWLDLSDCVSLEVISPDVISRLERLENLTMRNSFHKWEAERGESNASLSELKLLSQLTALEIHIPNADILPTNLFSNKLVRFQIYIGDAWKKRNIWEETMVETTLNTLKLKLTTSNEVDQGLKTLLKRCEDLSLDGTESVNSIVYQSDIEDFQQLKHLHLQNNVEFTHMIDRKVVFPNLTTLSVHSCGCLKFLFSFSMAKSLVELKRLTVSTCEIMEEIVSTRDEFNEETIDNIVFCKLESLTLDKLPNLARFCTRSYIEFPPEKKFDTELGVSICDPRISKKLDVQGQTDVQNYLFDAQVVFPNLTTLSVHSCGCLRFLFSFSMAKSLVKLKHLEVSTCEIMEEIVSTRDESNEETIYNMFCNLESLTLIELTNLSRFCTGSYVEFPSISKFDTELGASICDPRSSKKVDVKSETVVQNCLFDAQVKFSSLEKLEIKGLRNLQTIWNNQLTDQDSFCRLKEVNVFRCSSLLNMFLPRMMGRLNALETLCIVNCDSLEVIFEIGGTDVEERHADTSSPPQLGPFYYQSLGSVTISSCKSLKNIFPASVARGLQKLYQLTLVGCDEVEEIIVGEEGLETMPPQFVFPKVRSARFCNMPKLSRFYPGMHVSKWPLLTYLDVYNCNTVKMFAAKLPIFWEKHDHDLLIEQSLFLIDKDSFPNLEHLTLGDVEIWYGPSPAQFFSKLKSISFFYGISTPFSKQATLLFLQKLQNLDTLVVNWNDSEEINSVGEGEIHEVGTLTLPSVKQLLLWNLDNLLHLGNHNSQPTDPLFLNLDSLNVYECNSLKSVESSAISFRNLTTMILKCCDRLEYLTTYSVAKSLMQLTTLIVWQCERLREIIVASNEDAGGANCEIAFSRLQLLSLLDLPRLQGFCSGNCIVKLPSSTKLDVRYCEIELKISSQGVLLSNSKPTEEVNDGEKDNHETAQ